MTSISVIVPTYRRPDELRLCLHGLAHQHRAADEIIVVRRPDDLSSHDALAFCGGAVRQVTVTEPGAVAAYNAGLDAATGDIIAFLDDDTRPHAQWLEQIEHRFETMPELGGVGGRDIVHVDGKAIPPGRHTVGIVQFCGRIVGNHHVGIGGAREVHVLKGANMSFRREALASLHFDRRLRGTGAQTHLELGICAAVRRRGWRLLYDPDLVVDHFPAPRHDEDGREGFSGIAQANTAHNETLAVLELLPAWRRPVFLAWALAIGTRATPGLLSALRLLGLRQTHVAERLGVTLAGRLAGLRTYLGGAAP